MDPKWESFANHPDNMSSRQYSTKKKASIETGGQPIRELQQTHRDECIMPNMSFVRTSQSQTQANLEATIPKDEALDMLADEDLERDESKELEVD